MRPDPFPAFLLGVSNCRPQSEGYIHIRSRNPYHAPEIQPNYLSVEQDLRELLDGVRFIRELASAPALRSVIIEELRPGAACSTEEQLIEDIRNSAWTVFHASSTCRMGPDPSQDVVDHRLRVHGVQNLRIADTSIFPTLISGNTNAAAIMVGEKAADLILSDSSHEPRHT